MFPVLSSFPFSCELLLIDDGSTDATASLLADLAARHPSVTLVRHLMNQGLGASLRSGFEHAKGDAALTLDADLTFHPRQAELLINAFDPSVDAVLGSPLKGKMEGVSAFRTLLSHGVNLIYGLLFGKSITSASSLFRLYRMSKIKQLDLKSDSFDINAEILFKILRSGGLVREVGVVLTERQYGQSKIRFFREIVNHLRMFMRILSWRLTS